MKQEPKSMLKKTTLYEQVYDVMLGRIRSGEWQIGAFIPNE